MSAPRTFGEWYGSTSDGDRDPTLAEAFAAGRESMREEAAALLEGIADLYSDPHDIGANHSERDRHEKIAARIRSIPTDPEEDAS